jgi:hypothetical protein
VIPGEIQQLIVGLLEGIGAGVVGILVLIAGFCVLFGLPKLRAGGRKSMVVKNLDERLGAATRYLPPDAPRGTVDQLSTWTGGTPRSAAT